MTARLSPAAHWRRRAVAALPMLWLFAFFLALSGAYYGEKRQSRGY